MRSVVAMALVALAASASSASAASCDLVSLVPLLLDKRNDACATASGVAFPLTDDNKPTDAEWKRTCASNDCTSYYKELAKTAPTECTIGKFSMHADIIKPFSTACDITIDTSSSDAGPKTNSTNSVVADDVRAASGKGDDEAFGLSDKSATQPGASTGNTAVMALTKSAAPDVASTLALSTAAVVAASMLVL